MDSIGPACQVPALTLTQPGSEWGAQHGSVCVAGTITLP